MKLSIRIRTARLRSGQSQAALARLIGVSRTAVVNWESETNPTRPSSERLAAICRETGVSWEWLAVGRGQVLPSMDSIMAVDAEFIEDPNERRLLQLYREAGTPFRQSLIGLLEAHVSRRLR